MDGEGTGTEKRMSTMQSKEKERKRKSPPDEGHITMDMGSYDKMGRSGFDLSLEFESGIREDLLIFRLFPHY